LSVEKKKERRKGKERAAHFLLSARPTSFPSPSSAWATTAQLPLFPLGPLSSLPSHLGRAGPACPVPQLSRAPALSSLPFSLCQAGPARQRPFSLPLSSPAQRPPKLPASSLASGPHANVPSAAPQKGNSCARVPRTLTLAATGDFQRRRPLLRRIALSASPPSRRSAAPQAAAIPVSAPSRHPEASRAQHLCPEPLHHRESVTKLPPVSRSSPAILHRRRCPSFPNPSGTFTGPSRVDLR
jgi:hypothetical protein